MNTDPVEDAVRRWLATGVVRGDDKRFVSGPVQMLKNPQHRIRDTVDVGKEGLGDDGNTHAPSMFRSRVAEVEARNMSAVQSERIGDQGVTADVEVLPSE